MKKIAFCLMAVLALVACKENGDKPTSTTKDFKINNPVINLTEGSQERISVSPADADITWTSSNPEFATVNENGVVTAVAEGKATITGQLNGADFSATAEVTVMSFLDYIVSETEFIRPTPWSGDKFVPCEIKNADGTPLEVEFSDGSKFTIDSVYPVMYRVMDENIYIDGSNALAGTAGLTFDFYTVMYVVKDEVEGQMKDLIVPFGGYSVTDSAHTLVREEGDPITLTTHAVPYSIQSTNFNGTNYTAFYQAMLDAIANGGSANDVDADEFPYIGDEDAKILFWVADEESGSMVPYIYGDVNDGMIMLTAPDDGNSKWYKSEAYILQASLFENHPQWSGFATEEKTDSEGNTYTDWKSPLELADKVDVEFSLNPEVFAETEAVVAPQMMKFVTAESIRKQVKVNRGMHIAMDVVESAHKSCAAFAKK